MNILKKDIKKKIRTLFFNYVYLAMPILINLIFWSFTIITNKTNIIFNYLKDNSSTLISICMSTIGLLITVYCFSVTFMRNSKYYDLLIQHIKIFKKIIYYTTITSIGTILMIILEFNPIIILIGVVSTISQIFSTLEYLFYVE